MIRYYLHRTNWERICLITTIAILLFLWLDAKWEVDVCRMDNACDGCKKAFNEAYVKP